MTWKRVPDNSGAEENDKKRKVDQRWQYEAVVQTFFDPFFTFL